jgi:lysophospholipase L1-like esterase
MARSRSGKHDRRGFDFALKLHLGLGAVGLAVAIFYSWKIGLAIVMYACITFITLEVVSAPPVNNPSNFALWVGRRGSRKPVLLCLGDSLTHGTASANFTPEIPFKLSEALGLPPHVEGSFFFDPLWVVNAGQNGITSHTILNERLHSSLGCYPDFIFLMIGTNDLRCMYNKSWANLTVRVNELPETPTMQVFERNLKAILDHLYQSSPLSHVAVATLPPMGEDLKSPANQLVREANEMIERAVSNATGKVSLVPVFARLEAVVEKKARREMSLPVDYVVPLATVMCPLVHLMPFIFNWNRLSALVGNTVLSDGLHLNERGRDEVVAGIVEWLLKANVAKAIAVKQ